MSTNLQVGFIAEVRAWSVFGGQAAVNSWHYHVDSVGGNPSTDKDLSDTVDTAISGVYKQLLANNANYQGLQTQLVFPKPPSVDVTTIVSAGAGIGGAGELPPQVCGLISWYSQLAGRQGRGRTYVPFPSQVQNNAGGGAIPVNGYVTLLGTLATALRGVVNIVLGGRTATVSMCLMSKRAGHFGEFQRITNNLQRQGWATQRRRSEFGRLNNSPI